MKHHIRQSLIVSCALIATPVWAQHSTGKGGEGESSIKHQAKPAKQSFTTGVAKGRDMLDSAISASTLDETEIQKTGTRSIAEILSNIPGIRAETAGADGMTAVTIRGLPLSADGSKFLQVQEDGLPVLEFGDIHFGSTTGFLRADLSLAQVQAIRGGSASTFASNSPGGIVNFISKTGEETGGTLQLSSGIDHELGRADFNYGAKLSDSVRFNLGGYYRQGEGPRAAGYNAFKGGQVKFNITKTFGNGYVRLYAKLLDDREPSYGLVPVRVTGTNDNPSYAPLPGYDPRRDTMSSRYISSLLALDRNNNPRQIDVHEGNRAKVKSIGLEAQFDVAEWTLSNRLRYAQISGSYNENLPAITLPAAVLPIAFGAGPGTTARFASGPNSGQSIGNPATLNGNGLLSRGIYINADFNRLNNVTNDFRASRVWHAGRAKITTTAGLYASSQDIGMMWTFLSPITDIAPGGNSHLVDLIAPNGSPITQDGMLFYSLQLGPSSYHQYYDVNYRTLAPYGSVNYQLGALSLGASLRYDFGKVSGAVYGGDLGGGRASTTATDLNRDGVISPAERLTGWLPLSRPAPVDYNYGYASYSVGANYRVADSFSVFARYSRGGRASAERVLFPPSLNAGTGQLTDPALRNSPVKQAEAGAKFRRDGLSLFVTGFWASTTDKNYQIAADATGNTVVLPIDRAYSAKGVELEALVEQGPLSLRLGATYTKAKIDSDKADASAVGNTPRHQPDLMFQAMPQYQSRLFSIGTNIIGTTSSFAQDSNLLKQPGYVIVSPFLQVRPIDRIQLGLNVYNVFDKLAFVQVGSAAVPVGGVANAQVLNGRTITGSVRFSF